MTAFATSHSAPLLSLPVTKNYYKFQLGTLPFSAPPHGRSSLIELQTRAVSYSKKKTTCKTPVKVDRQSKASKFDRKSTKAVRFAPAAENTVAFRPAYDQEELRHAWYRPVEYLDFERSRRETIVAVQKVVNDGNMIGLDPSEHCITGLEDQLTRDQIVFRRLKAIHYTRLVLEQQKQQKQQQQREQQQQTTTMEAMFVTLPASSISRMFSRQSGKRAQLRAVLSSLDH